MSNGTCSHAGAVFSFPGASPKTDRRRSRQTTSRPPRHQPDMPFPFAASPYNNRQGAERVVYPVRAYRPVRPSCLKGRTDTLPAYDQLHHAVLQQLPAFPMPRPTMKRLPVHMHRRPPPPHIRQHKGYIHASPATETNATPAGHGPSLCPLPHGGCLLFRTARGSAG